MAEVGGGRTQQIDVRLRLERSGHLSLGCVRRQPYVSRTEKLCTARRRTWMPLRDRSTRKRRAPAKGSQLCVATSEMHIETKRPARITSPPMAPRRVYRKGRQKTTSDQNGTGLPRSETPALSDLPDAAAH